MEAYWNKVCGWMRVWHALLTMCSVALVLTVFSVFIAPRDSGAFVVTILNFVVLVPTIAGLLYVIVRCHNR